MDKNALEQLLFSYNWWMGVSTIAVAVGILGEYVAHFIFEKEARRNKLEMGISILFGVLVLGGVVGEYIFGTRLSQASEKLQQIADAEVAQANRDSAKARKGAELAGRQSAETSERAAKIERHAAEENARAAKALESAEKARKSAESFKLEIAQANERAAKANSIAEQERLERLQLEARLADRILSPAQEQGLKTAFARLKGKTVDITVVGDSLEIANFSNKIMACMREAGMLLNVRHPLGGAAARGVLIGVKPDAPPEFKQAGEEVVAILRQSVGNGASLWNFDELVSKSIATGANDAGAAPVGQSPFRIIFGSK
jgi:hypothetical protein